MEQTADNRLGTEPIGRLLVKLSVPAVTAQLVNVLYNMVDRMYIGHIPDYGHLALTGVGVCMPILLLVSAFTALVGMGGAPKASILMGEKKEEKAEEVLGNCTLFLLVLAALLTGILLIFGETLLLAFGASENTIGYALEYLHIYAIGTVFVQISLGLNLFISSQGFAKVGMATTLIGAVANIILDPIFIFGLNMGVAGAATATILSQAISAIWVLKFLTGSTTNLKIRTKNLRLTPSVLLPCLGLGLAPFIMQSTESLITVCFNVSLFRYGQDLAVGAMTITHSIMQFALLPLFGLSQGAQPITGYNYGAKQYDRVKKTIRLLLAASLVFSVTVWLLTMLFPRMFSMIFTQNEELLAFTARMMRVYMASVGFFGIQIACQQTLIAIGNAKASVFLAIWRKIILLVPLIYILPGFFEDKVFAVFLAEPVADFIAVATTAVLFSIQYKKIGREDSVETSIPQEETAPSPR